MIPSFKQLRYLCAVADHLHFSKAAKACHVTQSTLSAGIMELESQLGVILFERNKKQVLITPVGQRLLVQARILLGEMEDFVAIAQASQEPLSGDLRLGVIPTIGPFLLPPMLTELRAAYPQLRLYLKEDLSDGLYHKLLQGELDLVLLALPYPLAEMHVEPLFDEEGHCLRDHALEACRLKTTETDLVYQGTSLHTLVQMVANGLGITLLPDLALRSEILGDSHLPIRHFRREKVSRSIGLAWRQTDPRLGDYQALAKFITRWQLNRDPLHR